MWSGVSLSLKRILFEIKQYSQKITDIKGTKLNITDTLSRNYKNKINQD